MGELRIVSRRLCASCKYRMGVGNNVACNYLQIAGHSRLYENGVKMYDAAFCDKYESGRKLTTWADDLNLTRFEPEEYDTYKMQRVAQGRKVQKNV